MHARFVASSFPRCRNLVGVEPHPTWRQRHEGMVCGVVLTSLSRNLARQAWSHAKAWSGREDLNLRPLRPERSALPD